MLKTYYQLAKPGIIYGNALTAIGSFLLASKGHPRPGLFIAMLVGLCLVMASGCVYNNYLDRAIDLRMTRTKQRALVQGTVSPRSALIYAGVLGVVGLAILGLFTNLLATGIAAAGWFAYVVLYGLAKRRSVHGTIVGSISGAVPPVVGYVAASNRLDLGALILFAILVCWQMPHFYAIAMYRAQDYAAAEIPVLPLRKTLRTTKITILAYIAAFIVASVALTAFGYTGYTYLAVVGLLGLAWLGRGVRGLKTQDDDRWARGMFRFSLVVIMAFSVMISLSAFLP